MEDKITRRELIRMMLVGGAAGLVAGVAWLAAQRRALLSSCDLESLGLVRRAEWGAREPNTTSSDERAPYNPLTNPGGWLVYDQPLTAALDRVVVHHSALPVSEGPREIQDLHMDRRGFGDVGYHFLVDETGTLYEGRDLGVRGAHTAGANTGAVGVVLLGNFEEISPSDAQVASLGRLLRCLAARYPLQNLAGHRDFNPGATLCPGESLAALLPELARSVGLRFGI